MTRPESIDDVASHLRAPLEVFSWEPAYLGAHPEIEQHIVAARIAAKEVGFVPAGFGHNKVARERTEEELALVLKQAQESWDGSKVAYEAALESGMAPQYLHIGHAYSTAEGLPSLSDLVEQGKLRSFEKEES